MEKIFSATMGSIRKSSLFVESVSAVVKETYSARNETDMREEIVLSDKKEHIDSTST
jgi:hypothetical protein